MLEVFAAADQRLGPSEIADFARRVESLGYDGLNLPEAVHDGTVMCSLALAATRRICVAANVWVVFPRSPMVVANATWDLLAASGGRFELGLGTQVRGNIVRRYSTPWHPPVARMREYIAALRAIFRAFEGIEELAFKGEYYEFSRLQPFFNPGPLESGGASITLGAVGPKLTQLAGEMADALTIHPTASAPEIIEQRILPQLATGATRVGRSSADVRLSVAPLIATGRNEKEVAARRADQRELLGFLFSTPAYWGSLETLGYEAVGRELHELSRAGRWGEMSTRVPDALLDALVPSGPYASIAERIRERYGGHVNRVTFPVPPDEASEAQAREAIRVLRESG